MGLAGELACQDSCAMDGIHSIFSYHKVRPGETLPPAEDGIVDVAVLDMHHGYPNLGHNSIVQAVREASCDFEHEIRSAHLKVRVFSFDVRQHGLIPDPPGGRFSLYLGTGGPGHIDPHLNDGIAAFAQGVKEDPSWEPKIFALFDAILADPNASLVAVCHSFGVLCRWSGIARPQERGEEKGGKSAGIVKNELTAAAGLHPWFSFLALNLGSSRFQVIDSRLFDLVPEPKATFPITQLSYETLPQDGPVGEALTGVEFARDASGMMPRIFGVNHHPEIMDAGRQRLIVEDLWDRGEVTRAWYEERLNVVSQGNRDVAIARQLAVTTGFTFVWPLRFQLVKNLRQRAQRLGQRFDMHEDSITDKVIAAYTGPLPRPAWLRAPAVETPFPTQPQPRPEERP